MGAWPIAFCETITGERYIVGTGLLPVVHACFSASLLSQLDEVQVQVDGCIECLLVSLFELG